MFVCHKLEIEGSGTMFSLLEKFSIYLPNYTFYSLVKHALSQLYKSAVYKAMTINGPPSYRLTDMENRALSQITLMLDLLIYSFSTLYKSSKQLTNKITTELF